METFTVPKNSSDRTSGTYRKNINPPIELLDENAVYSKVDLVREINKLKKEIYVLTNR